MALSYSRRLVMKSIEIIDVVGAGVGVLQRASRAGCLSSKPGLKVPSPRRPSISNS